RLWQQHAIIAFLSVQQLQEGSDATAAEAEAEIQAEDHPHRVGGPSHGAAFPHLHQVAVGVDSAGDHRQEPAGDRSLRYARVCSRGRTRSEVEGWGGLFHRRTTGPSWTNVLPVRADIISSSPPWVEAPSTLPHLAHGTWLPNHL